MLPSIDPADFNFMPFDTSLIGPGTSFDFRGGLADACWQDLHFNAILPSSATALQQTMPPIQSYHFTQTDPISPLNTSVQPYNFAFAHDSDSAASMSLEDFDQRLESFDPHQVHDMTDASRYSESSSGVSIPYVNPISTAFISNQPRNLLSAAVFGNENGLEYLVPPAVSTYHFGAGQQPTLPADDGMDLYMKQISETACLHAQIDLFLNSDITLANDGMLKADRWETLTSSSVQSHRVPGATFNHSLEPSWIASHQQSQIGKESSIQQQGTLRDSNPRRKRKIDRKNGKACGLCKEQKGKCNAVAPDQPCRKCLDYALLDSSIGQRICFGYNEKASQARSLISDFYALATRRLHLDRWLDSEGSSYRQIKICHPPLLVDGRVYLSESPILELDVENGLDCFGAVETRSNGKGKISGPAESSALDYEPCELPSELIQYRIVKISIPNIKNLLSWGEQDLLSKAKHLQYSVENCLDALFLNYIKQQPKLPFHNLVDQTLRAMILARYLDERGPVEQLEEDRLRAACNTHAHYSPRKYAFLSLSARNQLFIHIAEQFELLETKILSEIDKFVFQKKQGRAWQPSCSDPLILGLCIRRMGLQYRRSMIRYKTFGPDLSRRYKRGRAMYDTMTRHYSHVFRGTLSPFHGDWDLGDHSETLGNDKNLKDRFEQLRKAEEYHFNNELDTEDDGVYLGMFVYKKNQKGQYPAKFWGHS